LSTPASGPLAGIRIIDLTSVIMGPLATQILGDMGADVVVIEPTIGTMTRVMSPGPVPGLSGIALNLLRNKQNVSLDLKVDRAREIVLRLVEGADVFVTNLRPAPLTRLGLDYQSVAARKADIVYCQAQGFPSDGDRANDPAYDEIIQAASGLADLFARVDGTLSLAPTIMADKITGMTMVSAILAALLHRERSGQGQRVEVPMIDAMRAFILVEHGAAAIARPPQGPPGYRRVLNPHRRPQATLDGWVHILPYSRENYVDLFNLVDRSDLINDPRIRTTRSRIEHASELYELVAQFAVKKTTDAWLSLCREHYIPVTRVLTLEELIEGLPEADHPIAGPFGLIPSGARFYGTPLNENRLPAAMTGQHSRLVLSELGLADDEIDSLVADGVVRTYAEETRPTPHHSVGWPG
jgi:crotonobetainyl-CoA:carnitine CoA-transferase CaiB-like acyl-CoA transferase